MAKQLSSSDVKRLRDTIASIHSESFFCRLQRLLKAKIRFHTFILMRFDPDASPDLLGAWLKPDTFPSDVIAAYTDGAYRLDPFFQHPDLPKQGLLCRLSDIAPDRFFSGEYFQDYYRQTRLCDEVGLLVPLPSGSVAHLSFSRLESAGPYRRKEMQCLQHYAPVLLGMLADHCDWRQSQSRQAEKITPSQPLNEVIRAQVGQHFGAALTRREAQVAGLVLQGHSNGSAAMSLEISRETCKVHRRNLYRKLNISSQQELFSMLKHLL